jgi:DNA polymerase/3'-5' exonuclease PolX
MPEHNVEIAAIFDEIANLLEIQGDNPFRIRAYRNAARTIGGLSQDIDSLVKKDADLTRLPGIGDDLATKIKEIVTTGNRGLLQRLHRELPPIITELLKIPGIGPKRVKTLYHDLDVQTVERYHKIKWQVKFFLACFLHIRTLNNRRLSLMVVQDKCNRSDLNQRNVRHYERLIIIHCVISQH